MSVFKDRSLLRLLAWIERNRGLFADMDSARMRPVPGQVRFADRLLPWP
jgi:hypothetical protein